ncbi:MAG: DUF393 domain-containing protein [Bdellovibrio sp.]|nr:DUF393 domain-containing protein [Bdellovibrio sp.]
MERIIFFDGICPLCNRFVDFVIKRDKKRHFLFASLQSEQAQKLLSPQDLGLDSVILTEDKLVYQKSKAVLRILFALGGGWTLLALLLSIFPNGLRDIAYAWIAKNRYRFFGKFESCRIPRYDERKYFLE